MTKGNDLINSTDTRFVEVDEDGMPIYAMVKEGLTKREYFAAMALQGLLANPNYTRNPLIGQTAVSISDVLIKALNETP